MSSFLLLVSPVVPVSDRFGLSGKEGVMVSGKRWAEEGERKPTADDEFTDGEAPIPTVSH